MKARLLFLLCLGISTRLPAPTSTEVECVGVMSAHAVAETALDEETLELYRDTLTNLGLSSQRALKIVTPQGVKHDLLRGVVARRGITEPLVDKLLQLPEANIFRMLRDPRALAQLKILSQEETSPALLEYARHIIAGSANNCRPIGRDLEGARSILALPPAVTTGVELGQGSGGTAEVWKATLDGKTIVVKISLRRQENWRDEDRLAVEHLRDAKRMEAYGGPTTRGMVRVKDSAGYWRQGVAMDLVEGTDLLKLRSRKGQNQPLPFPITAAHVRSMEALIAKAKTNKVIFTDVQPGDFMLTRDGRVVPLDMTVVPISEVVPVAIGAFEGAMNEHLTTLRALATYSPRP